MPLFDLERTEVLRGPQGTLFGRNTPAGIVKFDTVRPSQERDGFVSASYGTFDTIDAKAAFGGALTETLSARVSVLYQSQSDWIDNGFTGENDALGGHNTGAFRLQFLWEPNDRFSALVNVHGWELDGTARVFRANILKPGTNDLVERLLAGQGLPGRPERPGDQRPGRRLHAQLRIRLRYAHRHHRLRDPRHVQPRRHRRRLRRGLRAAVGPRLHPVPLRVGRRHSGARPVHPGDPAGERHRRRLGLARRLLLLRREPPGRELQLRLAGRQRPGRLRLPDPGRRVLGALRLARLPADRPLDAQGRPALHHRREGLLGRASRSDLPVADRRGRSGLRPTPTS